jgi:hypothetical protein
MQKYTQSYYQLAEIDAKNLKKAKLTGLFIAIILLELAIFAGLAI